ncbi:MAG: phospholipid scramblase-related protein [Verrucomicrobiia bacterium]|jgi:uncharacterized protein YxjI
MLLDYNQFFIKEHVGAFKLTDAYDILDPETETKIGIAREEPPGWAKFLRLVVNKRLMPTTINVYEADEQTIAFSIRRSFALFAPKIPITDATGQEIGHFKGKTFALKAGFYVNDPQGNRFAEVKGDWKAWTFRFMDSSEREIGTVSKKWAGMAKEFFTSADNYMIDINPDVAANPVSKILLLAAGLAVDMIFKEN